jgi:hypothetical protein
MFFLGAVLGVVLAGGLGLWLGRRLAAPEPAPPPLRPLGPHLRVDGPLRQASPRPLLRTQPRTEEAP